MRTVVLGEPPFEIEQWLKRRRALGQDRYDEVWEGEYHVAPGPSGPHGWVDDQLTRVLGPFADRAGLFGCGTCNIGGPDNYRVPDHAYFTLVPVAVFNSTAALVVEIVSPGDESRAKFGFYFQAGVIEVLIVDPGAATVEWYRRSDVGFVAVPGSTLLDISAARLQSLLIWPA